MKLKFFYLSLIGIFTASYSFAADVQLEVIKQKGYVTCGTDLHQTALASKDKDGYYRGIDADICRLFAIAIIGNEAAFKLKHVEKNQINSNLRKNLIDVMLGNTYIAESKIFTSAAAPIGILYYDNQIFATIKPNDATSMQEFKGQKICVLDNSADLSNLINFNEQHIMDFKILKFHTYNDMMQAFYLKRCNLVTGSKLLFKGIEQNPISKNAEVMVLPEIIAVNPVYAYISKKHTFLQNMGKVVINVPKIAEALEIDSKTTDNFKATRNKVIKNLLGINPDFWLKLGFEPGWAKDAIKKLGNFGEIYERNIGNGSELKIERGYNNLFNKNGLMFPRPTI